MSDEIMVSIICNAYNHEDYIATTLDGFLMQKTNFAFEVLVHDDASTDRTADIIRDYEKKYPNIIKAVYQIENQYSKRDGTIARLQINRARGKYIASCEGDDYWTDEIKLQKQFDIMESDPKIGMCTHAVRKEQNGELLAFYPTPEIETGTYEGEEALNLPYMQTSCHFCRAEYIKELFFNPPKYKKVAKVGDEPKLLFFRCNFKVYHINQVMSVYRFMTPGSWSSRNSSTVEKIIDDNLMLIEMYKAFDEETHGKYNNFCTVKILEKKMKMDVITENFSNLLKKEYRPLMKKKSFKFKVLVLLTSIFPKRFKKRWKYKK